MEPTTTGALIAAGGAVLGGIAGRGSDWRAAQQAEFDREAQMYLAQHGVQLRVKDAVAAGLHPLYALGANVPTYSPVSYMGGEDRSSVGRGISEAGQHIGRAVAAQETPAQRDLRLMTLRQASAAADRDDAQAAYYRSLAARVGQEANVSAPSFGPDVVIGRYKSGSDVESHPLFSDAVKLKPDELISQRSNAPMITASPAKPGLDEYSVGRGFKMLMPRNDEGWSEGWESLSLMQKWGLIWENQRHYGGDWWRRYFRWSLGVNPDKEIDFTPEVFQMLIKSLDAAAVRERANPARLK